MSTLHVVTDVVNDEDVIDEYTGDHVTYTVDPSAVLTVFSKPGALWTSYAPGAWKVVRDVGAH